MAEFNYKYKDMAERADKIAEAEGLGLRMLHDTFDPDWKRGDEPHGTLTFTDEPAPVISLPPLCTHWAIIDSFNIGQEKPVRVKRTWDGREYAIDCYVTESVKDQYQAGDVAIGDHVLVEFLDNNPDRATVFAKVFKT